MSDFTSPTFPRFVEMIRGMSAALPFQNYVRKVFCALFTQPAPKFDAKETVPLIITEKRDHVELPTGVRVRSSRRPLTTSPPRAAARGGYRPSD